MSGDCDHPKVTVTLDSGEEIDVCPVCDDGTHVTLDGDES